MNAEEFEKTLVNVEQRIDRLKAIYEQYFQGIERLEPAVLRREVDRGINALRGKQPRNTALRFRFQQLMQRYVTFNAYWNRTNRQIEEGTYQRENLRARRRREADRQRRVDRQLGYVELDLDSDFEELTAEYAESFGARPSEAGASEAKSFDVGDMEAYDVSGSDVPNRKGSTIPSPPSTSSLPIIPVIPKLKPLSNIVSPPPAPGRAVKLDERPSASAPQTPASSEPPEEQTPQPQAPKLTQMPPPLRMSMAPKLTQVPPKLSMAPPQGSRLTQMPQAPKISGLPDAPRASLAPPTPRSSKAPEAVAHSMTPPSPSGLDAAPKVVNEQRMREVYRQFVETCRAHRQPTDNVSYDRMVRKMQQWVPQVNEKHPGKRVDFEVVVVDGRVGIKPTTRDT